MSRNRWHISDEELVLAADGELKDRRAAQIRRHLMACWKCRERIAQMESAVVDFVQASQSDGPDLPSIEGPRALLRARLAALSTQPVRGRWWQRLFAQGALAYALAAVVLMAAIAGGQILRREMLSRMSRGSPSVLLAGALPNPRTSGHAGVASGAEKGFCGIRDGERSSPGLRSGLSDYAGPGRRGRYP
jgi:anti-sigma factor RsiW